MKTLYAILIAGAMMIPGIFATAQAQDSLWGRQNPAKGIYFGSSGAEDILSRHQEAIAAAVIEYAMMENSTMTGVVESYTTTSGTYTPVDSSTNVNSGSCRIEIIEYKDYGDRAEILVRIDSRGNDYTYEIKVDNASMEIDGKTTFRSNSLLKLADKSGKMLMHFTVQDTDTDHLCNISFSSYQTR